MLPNPPLQRTWSSLTVGTRPLNGQVVGQRAMSGGKSQKELEKALRKSRRALPYQAAFGVAAALGVWAAHRFLGLSSWLAWLLAFFALFGALGDAINIIYCQRALGRFGRDGGERP